MELESIIAAGSGVLRNLLSPRSSRNNNNPPALPFSLIHRKPNTVSFRPVSRPVRCPRLSAKVSARIEPVVLDRTPKYNWNWLITKYEEEETNSEEDYNDVEDDGQVFPLTLSNFNNHPLLGIGSFAEDQKEFQELYSPDQVFDMMNDGSYLYTFQKFLDLRRSLKKKNM